MISLITPTYNRKAELEKLYYSLENQTSKDFEWIIVDDGSRDGTCDFIENLTHQSAIKIKYLFKENGGKHTAINQSHSLIEGSFAAIVDSDDYLVPNCIERIEYFVSKYNDNISVGVLSFLKSFSSGQIIGVKYPKDEIVSNHVEMRINGKITGDKFEVVRTNVFKSYQFPIYENERFFGEGYLWSKIGKEYSTVYINEVLYIAEYNSNGLTNQGRKLRLKNPISGFTLCLEVLSNKLKLIPLIKYSLSYNIYFLLSKKKGMFRNELSCMKKVILIALTPASYLLYIWYRVKYRLDR